MTTIRITVPRSADRPTRIEVEGHPGPGCQDLTANIEKALGGSSKTKLTDEYYTGPIEQDNELEQGNL